MPIKKLVMVPVLSMALLCAGSAQAKKSDYEHFVRGF